MRSLVCAAALVIGLGACDTGQPKVELEPQKAPKSDKPKKPEMTPEQLAEARRKAGFKDTNELAEENIAAMRKGEREWVKTRLAEHRAMLDGVRKLLERAEKAAPKWPKAKDAQKAFEGFSEKYKEDAKALDEDFDALMEGGSQIDVQAKLITMYRSFENFNGDLGPEISAEEGFGKGLEDLRAQIDEIVKELDAIEKDESLKVNENYEAGAEGDAKPKPDKPKK
ncbi:MAG: hypothetical protein KDK70_13470 [Myxococcales bacterium]|nr:hypothetical protein [Myxococcales bacterium]